VCRRITLLHPFIFVPGKIFVKIRKKEDLVLEISALLITKKRDLSTVNRSLILHAAWNIATKKILSSLPFSNPNITLTQASGSPATPILNPSSGAPSYK